MNLSSKFNDISAVVALAPSHVTFPSITITSNTSSWTFNEKELPALKTPLEAIWYFVKGDSKEGLRIALENEKYWKHAAIEVENINGPILLMSAKNDELWPSYYMSEKINERLMEKQFKHYYQHVSFEGKHHDTKKHFEVVFQFLNEHFK